MTEPPGGVPSRTPRDPVADRQALEADDEARLDPFGLAGELDVLEAAGQLGEERALRAARQMRAEAEVLAVAEAHVPVRIAVDAEAEGLVEDGLVAIGRRVEEDSASRPCGCFWPPTSVSQAARRRM